MAQILCMYVLTIIYRMESNVGVLMHPVSRAAMDGIWAMSMDNGYLALAPTRAMYSIHRWHYSGMGMWPAQWVTAV